MSRSRILVSVVFALGACKEPLSKHAPKRAKQTVTAERPRTVPFESRALSLAWTGLARLPFDARRLSGDHTLFVRFMPAYEGGYRGVLVSDESASYRVGLAPYASLNQPGVEVTIGNRTITVPLPDPILSSLDVSRGARPAQGPRWVSVAVSVRGSEAKVFVDGASSGALELEARELGSELWIGRLARAQPVRDQFYGLVDDVAIFERALTEPEMRALARTPRLSSKLAGLLALATFDAGDRDRIELEPRLSGAASLRPVSLNRDTKADSAALPRPTAPRELELPFEKGQTWMVIQGTNSVGTHHDTAAFALDFQRVEPPLVEHNPERRPGASAALSGNQPFFAAASGRVVSLVDCFREDGRGCERTGVDAGEGEAAKRNLVCVEHSAGLVSCYLHLKTASVRLGESVARGEMLGIVGRTGTSRAHLHFAVSDLPEPSEPGGFSSLTTIPFEFRNYEASSDFGRSWEHVEAGTPTVGQWVRRAQ